MQIERIRPTTYRMTLHTYELAALISAARWITEGAEGELLPEVKEQMTQILASYDAESQRLRQSVENK